MFNGFSLTVVQNASKWHLIETDGTDHQLKPQPQPDPEPEMDPELPLEETVNNEYSEDSENRVMVSYDYDFDSENKASVVDQVHKWIKKQKKKPSTKRKKKKKKKKTKKQKRGCKGRCRKKGQNKVMVEYSGFVDDRNPWIKKVCGC